MPVDMELDPAIAFINRLENPQIKLGTDGLRKKAEVITDLAPLFAESVALTFDSSNVFLVGTDTRLSGPAIRSRLIDTLTSTGADVIDCGIIPTPAISWLTREISAGRISVPGIDSQSVEASGIIATASHNPPSDNGLKPFCSNGEKLNEDAERKLTFYMNSPGAREWALMASDNGDLIAGQADTLRGMYEESLVAGVREDLFAGKKVVVDAGFGAAYQTAPNAIGALGADVVKVACESNGEEINVAYGATHTDATAAEVIKNNAEFGIALDGDADRVMLVSKQGRVLDGDRMMLILAMSAMQRSQPGDITKVVGTVMSNYGLRQALQEQAARFDRQVEFTATDVGDIPVARTMAEQGANIGGEQAGHILFNGEVGDGVRSAIQVMKALDELDMTLDEAYDLMEDYPQVLKNAEMPDAITRDGMDQNEVLRAMVDDLTAGLEESGVKGRILLRPSGTENLYRVMVELEQGHEELAKELTDRLLNCTYEQAWPSDIEELGYLPYGDKTYRVTAGRDPRLVGQILEGAREKHMNDMVPKDIRKRFKNRASFEDWYSNGKYLVALWDENDNLAGIIWHGESPIEKEIENLRRDGAIIEFEDRIPTGSNDTFAIRLYEHSRHQKVEYEEMSLARKFMALAQMLYEDQAVLLDRAVQHIWLETNLYDKQGKINGAVHLYHKAGYTIVGTYDNPDKSNPEVRVMMISNMEDDTDLVTKLQELGIPETRD